LTQEFFLPAVADFAPVGDFQASVEVNQLKGSDYVIAGLVFRADPNGFYAFTVNRQGDIPFSFWNIRSTD